MWWRCCKVIHALIKALARLSERPKEADCKSAGLRLQKFESSTWHHQHPPRCDRGGCFTLPCVCWLVVCAFCSSGASQGGELINVRDMLAICVLCNDRVNLSKASTERAAQKRKRLLSPQLRGCAPLAQSVERFHGKEKVSSSILLGGSVACMERCFAAHLQVARRCSSAGESARLIIARSRVRVSPPLQPSEVGVLARRGRVGVLSEKVVSKGRSSIGRATVSKTVGCRFESCRPCHSFKPEECCERRPAKA